MALKTVANLRDSVAGILSGVDLNNVDDVNGCFERAASTLIQNADVPEASGIQNITLYSGVFDYACNPKIFGTAINDIRPQGISRNPSNFVSKVDQEDFDRTKDYYLPSGTRATFQYQNGSPIIRIVAPFPKTQVIVDPMSVVGTSPNAWTASGSASTPVADYTVFYETPASLRFTLTGASTGALTRTLQNPLSIADYQGVGVAFLAIRVPDGTDISGVQIKLGSDSGNYTSSTVQSAAFLGAFESDNWFLISFDMASGTDTGTPNWSAIDYVQVSILTTATITNARIGGLWLSLPSPAQILYQSAAIFLPTGTSVPLTTITATTDEIILTDPAYNIYLQECALSVLQNTGAGASDASSVKINETLHGNGGTIIGLYPLYRGDNPSQEIRTTGSWYDTGMPYSNNNYY